MAINFVDISLNDDSLQSEHGMLNTYLLSGWQIIGHSTFTSKSTYGEFGEFEGDTTHWERYTLFKPDQTIGESIVNGSNANVFHFDNGDGTIGQMQITNDAPATNLDNSGEWHHTSDGTEFPTVYNDAYSFTLESFAESLNLHKVLRQYAVEKESARVRIAELEREQQSTARAALNVTTRFEQSAMNAQDEIDTLKSRLQKELNHIVNLEYVINHAFRELRTYDGNSGAIIAARIMLEPYTKPSDEA